MEGEKAKVSSVWQVLAVVFGVALVVAFFVIYQSTQVTYPQPQKNLNDGLDALETSKAIVLFGKGNTTTKTFTVTAGDVGKTFHIMTLYSLNGNAHVVLDLVDTAGTKVQRIDDASFGSEPDQNQPGEAGGASTDIVFAKAGQYAVKMETNNNSLYWKVFIGL